MDSQKPNSLKQKLEEELALVEKELEHIGKKNLLNDKVDWQGKPADFDVDSADQSEVSDKIEEYEENTAVLKNLEIRYNRIKNALNKFDLGSYGICEVCAKPIEEDRLEANPAAPTCKTHMI
jgi:DnaK suppressor protein